jgi:hypothetical protein
MSTVYNKLDPSIKSKLNKPGITVIQNIHTGFDTEYKYLEGNKNDLISVQLAVNTQSILKIPKMSDYYACSIDALSNRKSKVEKHVCFNYTTFEQHVSKCISEIRKIKYKDYDILMSILSDGFKKISKEGNEYGLRYFAKDDYYVVSFPRTPVEKYVYLNEHGQGYNFTDLITVSCELGNKYLDADYAKIRILLKEIQKHDVLTIVPELSELQVTNDRPAIKGEIGRKRYSRSLIRSMDLNINRIRNNYVIAHLTNADLSMLNDFEELKEHLDIVNRSFVTLGKPLQMKDINIYIRDTMLLAPAGKKSLASLGDLLNLPKIKLHHTEIEAMDVLLQKDRSRFLDYASNDAVITLLYANSLEDQLFQSRGLGIPISLSSLSGSFVKDEWDKMGYSGYQLNHLYLIGDTGATQTPKGLYVTKNIGRKMSMYISNYKGGRNESFMYGVDNKTMWYDYDLTSAYTTAMAILGNPDYKQAKTITEESLNLLSDADLIRNYIILSVKFKFPDEVKYPSIPCQVDETTTIYPLSGKAVITGIEYLLAKNQGCVFTDIEDIFMIPFERKEIQKVLVEVNHPFKDLIRTLQSRRRSFPKGSLSNLMEKEKGNSIYGNIVRGMSNKKKYDIKTGRTIRMEGSALTNPIIAS